MSTLGNGLDRKSKLTALVDRIREIARDCGYAVAVHGSLRRDLDLVAVPWTDEAIGSRELVDALCDRGSFVLTEEVGKPHGRVGYVLQGIPGRAGVKYIDLSVMSRSRRPATYARSLVGGWASRTATRDMTASNLIDQAAALLIARSGGHFEPIRDMSEEKARGDAKAVLGLVLDQKSAQLESLGSKP